MEKEIYTTLGLIITFIGYAAYIYTIFKGQTRPHPFSWTVWGILTLIGFIAQLSDGAGHAAWITGASAFISLFISALAYWKRSDIVITRSDLITFVVALLAIPLWMVTETPLYSVILITVIDMVSFYPTFNKTWHNPQQELGFEYVTAALKYVFSIMALQNYTIITVLYPASLVLMNTAFLIMQYYRRQRLKR